MMAVNPGRSLYRAMLRAALRVPEENKRNLALDRIRTDFRKHAGEKDPEELRQHFLVGYTQLENLEVQGEHLTKIQEGDLSYILGGKHFGG